MFVDSNRLFEGITMTVRDFYTTPLKNKVKAIMISKKDQRSIDEIKAHQKLGSKPHKKRMIIFTGGMFGLQDSPGVFAADGLITHLLNFETSKLANYLLEKFDFYFVPYMNPDAASLGLLYRDGSGHDIRKWLDTSTSHQDLRFKCGLHQSFFTLLKNIKEYTYNETYDLHEFPVLMHYHFQSSQKYAGITLRG